MTALARTSAMCRWVLCLWLGELLVAALAAYAIRSHIAAAMDEFAVPDGHVLYAIAEFAGAHPELLVSILVALGLSTVLGFVVWTLLAPLVLLRLGGASRPAAIDAPSLGAAWLGAIVPATATSAWHLAIRVGLVIVVGQSVVSLPPAIGAPVAIVVGLLATCALDHSRVAVVLEGARGANPRVALDGFARLLSYRGPSAVMVLLAAVQWLLVLAGLVAVVRTGGAALSVMRACAAAATFCGVFRLAVATGVRPRPTAPEPDDT